MSQLFASSHASCLFQFFPDVFGTSAILPVTPSESRRKSAGYSCIFPRFWDEAGGFGDIGQRMADQRSQRASSLASVAGAFGRSDTTSTAAFSVVPLHRYHRFALRAFKSQIAYSVIVDDTPLRRRSLTQNSSPLQHWPPFIDSSKM